MNRQKRRARRWLLLARLMTLSSPLKCAISVNSTASRDSCLAPSSNPGKGSSGKNLEILLLLVTITLGLVRELYTCAHRRGASCALLGESDIAVPFSTRPCCGFISRTEPTPPHAAVTRAVLGMVARRPMHDCFCGRVGAETNAEHYLPSGGASSMYRHLAFGLARSTISATRSGD